MYRIRDIERDQWTIVDGRDQTVFVGTRQQVEDWLDFRENGQRQPSPRISLRGLLHVLIQLLARLAGRLGRPSRHRSLGR